MPDKDQSMAQMKMDEMIENAMTTVVEPLSSSLVGQVTLPNSANDSLMYVCTCFIIFS